MLKQKTSLSICSSRQWATSHITGACIWTSHWTLITHQRLHFSLSLSALYVHSRKYIFPPVSKSAQHITSQQWRSPLWIAAVCLISGSIHFLIPKVLKVITGLFFCRLMTPDQSRIRYDCGGESQVQSQISWRNKQPETLTGSEELSGGCKALWHTHTHFQLVRISENI